MSPRVLCLTTDGLEEMETLTPIDLLRRAGVEVTLASMKDGIHLTGRSGITLHADACFEQVQITDYHLLLLPGGPAVAQLRTDARVLTSVRAFAAAGKTLAAICAAPLILKDAGVLLGHAFTAHDSCQAELPQAQHDQPVVISATAGGRLITSRGAGTSLEFSLALITELCGPSTTEKVTQAIMAG
jgi:protein deglycase